MGGMAYNYNVLSLNYTNSVAYPSGYAALTIQNGNNTSSSISSIGFNYYDDGNVVRWASSISAGKDTTGTTPWVSGSGNYPSNLQFFVRNNAGTSQEVLRMNSFGNVGIGTATPTLYTRLTVEGTNNAIALGRASANGGYGEISSNTTSVFFFGNSYYNTARKATVAGYSPYMEMSLSTGQTVFFTSTSVTADTNIVTTGKVYINPTGSTLTVYTDGSTTNDAINVVDTRNYAAGVGGGITFSGKYDTNSFAAFGKIAAFKENSSQGDYASGMTFYIRTNGNSLTERMRITSAGSVKMGAVLAQGVWVSSSGSPTYGSEIYLTQDLGSTQGAVRLRSSYSDIGSSGSNPNFEISRATNSQAYANDPSSLTYTTSLAIVGATGNVGVGTAVPVEKIHVNGNIRIDDASGNDGFNMVFDNISKTLNFVYAGA